MAFSEFAVGDLVKLIEGTLEETEAIWRISDFTGDWKLEKYNGSKALSRKMITENENIRGLTDEELNHLSKWSRGSFVRAIYQKPTYRETYVGRIRRIVYRENSVWADVVLAGECISAGIARSGEPTIIPIRHYVITLEKGKLMDPTEADVEWLEDHFAQSPKEFVLPEPQYHCGWITETVIITSASEIEEAAAGVKKQIEAGPGFPPFLGYGAHKNEKGELVYTRKETRPATPEEVEQHRLLSEEKKKNGNPRTKGFPPQSFDDILHPDKMRWGIEPEESKFKFLTDWMRSRK